MVLQLEQYKAEYYAAVENLATDKGFCHNKTTFVVAHKH
jgi:hypothetical protein